MANPHDQRPVNAGKVSANGRSGFVGRTRELQDLRDSLDGALSGAGRLYLIAGEPGIGKTRLADELVRYANERGVLAIWGRCWEGGGASAYWPWRQIVRGCLRTGDASRLIAEMGSCAHDLTNVAPEAREYISEGHEMAPLPSDPEQARFRLFDSVATFLRLVSTYRPLVVLLEDLHAADLPSLLLLRFVARNLSDAGILMVGTYRDAELRQATTQAELLGQLASDSLRISLRGLNADEVRELLKIEHGEKIADETISAVYQATDGNPLFVHEISRSTLAQEVLEAKHTGSNTLLIPKGVRAAIERHLAPLSNAAKQALTTASVIGREFEFAVLQRVAGVEVEELIDAIAEARNAGLIIGLPDRLGRYRFSHSLVRDAVYEDMPAASVARLHTRIGEVLEEIHRGDPDVSLSEVAHHFLQGAAAGGDPARAVEYTKRAAEYAASTLAYEEAERLYQMALRASRHQQVPDEAQRCELLIGLAEVQDRAGNIATARETFKTVADLAVQVNAPEMLGRAALGIGTMAPDFHAVDTESVTLMRRALDALGENDSAIKAELLAQLAVKLYMSHDRRYREELIAQAVATARSIGDQRCLLFVLNAKRRALWETENLKERLATMTEALQLAQQCGDREEALRALHLQIGDLTELGDLDSARAGLSTFIRSAQKLRQPWYLWVAAYLEASLALLEGRLEEAERLANEALMLGQNLGSADPMYTYSAQVAVLYREKGRLNEVESLFASHAERNPGIPVFRCTTAYIRVELGRDPEVRREFDYLMSAGFDALPRRGVDWPVVVMLLSEMCCHLRDTSRAPIIYELMLPYADRNLTSFHIVAFGSAATSLGKLATLMERFDAAADHFEHALRFNDRIGARPWLADTQYEYARMLLRRNQPGDREYAARLLLLAAATAETIGSVRLTSKVAALRAEQKFDATQARSDSAASVPIRGEPPTAATTSRPAPGDEEPAPTRGIDGAAEFRLYREGDYWTIVFGGKTTRLKHVKGLLHIQTLLSSPGREFHALNLAGGGSSQLDTGPGSASAAAILDATRVGELSVVADLGGAGETLDSAAKAAYRQRLTELREELAVAEENGDVDRASNLEDEIEAITTELRRAVGLMGRDRMVGSVTERARLNVTRAIKTAVERIAEHDADFGRLLARTIRTGTFCCYIPDPANPL